MRFVGMIEVGLFLLEHAGLAVHKGIYISLIYSYDALMLWFFKPCIVFYWLLFVFLVFILSVIKLRAQSVS
jgi:hypothetical protein